MESRTRMVSLDILLWYMNFLSNNLDANYSDYSARELILLPLRMVQLKALVSDLVL